MMEMVVRPEMKYWMKEVLSLTNTSTSGSIESGLGRT